MYPAAEVPTHAPPPSQRTGEFAVSPGHPNINRPWRRGHLEALQAVFRQTPNDRSDSIGLACHVNG